jgi:hypothetical protein
VTPPPTFEAFRDNRLTPEQLEFLFLEDRATLESWMTAKRDALEAKARAVIASTLTEAWRRLIGPAVQLVEALMLERLTAELEIGRETTGHLFASQDALASKIGVTARTLRNWLSEGYSGSKWLACWISRRTWYVTRSDGFRSRGGTIWRVSLEARSTDDVTPAPRVSYDALRTPWRSAEDLPGAVSSVVLDDSGNQKALEENVPKSQGRLEVRVEGKHQVLFHDIFQRSGFHSGNTLPTPARAQFAQAWAKAETVASKLGDRHSTGFWFSQFRALEVAGKGDGAVWSAVAQGLEARASGSLRSTPGAYAVGILKRSARA